MTMMLRKGRYGARLADGAAGLARAQALRHQCFLMRGAARARPDGLDRDAFDAHCRHVLIEDAAGTLAATFRFLPLRTGADIDLSYAAQFYDISGLLIGPPIAELGRFCIRPDAQDGETLRAAWGALAGLVRKTGAETLFGCASFPGARAADHAAALAHLHARHLGPADRRPAVHAPETVPLADLSPGTPRETLRQLPPLLRSYLSLGGWVGDTAVIDRDLDTLHVFTALDIADVPAARVRSLLALTA